MAAVAARARTEAPGKIATISRASSSSPLISGVRGSAVGAMSAPHGRVNAIYPTRVASAAIRVSSPSDPAEREAEAVARSISQVALPRTQQVASASVHRKADSSATVAGAETQEIRASMASGVPLPQDIRGFMEPRFKADFSGVRIHTDERAAALARRLSARAFTFGGHIFFAKGQFRPETREGVELIAHELTHTIQQQAVIQRSEAVTVAERSTAEVQRFGVSDALDYFADKANLIPGFRMFTIILGVNPINMSRVERYAATILRAVI
jgi:hypothetical protein